jgi:hypothetical protein
LLIREIENLKLNYAVLNKKMNQLDNVIEAIEDRDNNLYRTYFNTSHIKEERKSGLSGTDRYADLQGYNTHSWYLTPQKGRCSYKELVIQSKSLDYILKLAKEKISYCLPFLPFNLSGTKI